MNKIEIEDPDKIVHPDEKDGEGTRLAPCTRCGTSIWYDDSEPVICAECAAFLRGLAYARTHARVAGPTVPPALTDEQRERIKAGYTAPEQRVVDTVMAQVLAALNASDREAGR